MTIISILLAGLVCFVIGFLIHGPIAGKLWMKLAEITPTGNEKLSDMYGQMAWNYVVNVLSAAALWVVLMAAATSPLIGMLTWFKGGLIAGFIWLGFLATGSSMEVIWMGRKFSYWLFEAVASCLCFISMGIVLTLFI